MKLQSVKDVAEVKLEGIEIAATYEDKTLKELRLRDANGVFVIVKPGETYTQALRVFVPAPPEKVDRWFVTGRFLDVMDVDEGFEDSGEANDRLREFMDKSGSHGSGLKVEKRQVAADAPVAAPADEMPF